MKFFYLKIYATAVPKQRVRVTRRGTFTPEKTRVWEEQVRLLAKQKVNKVKFGDPWDGPVKLWVSFYFRKPKYLPKKIKAHTKKPDLDNLLKSIKDSLNKIVYNDDSQIIISHMSKNYLIGENARPFVNIKIECISHDDIIPIHDCGVDSHN